MLQAVETGQQRMIDLVGIVLGYFDLAGEASGTQPVSPVAPMWLVDDLLRAQAAAMAAKKLRVLNQVPADLVVLANEQRLRRVLGYLIDNAVNFSPDGGEIAIGGNTETYGTRGVISVRDHGRGIDSEHLPRLFEPFFMVGSHHRDGGFGLSLATAKLLASHMGGDIRVRSAGRGQGAEFSVVLPIAGAAVARPAGDPLQSPAG
ncbi:MAG: sensor histidine kinase [Pseudomonadota bacterium]